MNQALKDRLLALAREAPDPFPAAAFARAVAEAGVQAAAEGVVEVRSGGSLLARLERHGTLVLFDPEGAGAAPRARRLLAISAKGELVEQVLWNPAEGVPLELARLRLPMGRWLQISVGTGNHPLWEQHSDEIFLGEDPAEGPWVPLTQMESLAYERLSHIPAAAQPARLEQGAGGVLLNFLAELARDQHVATLRYRGPYPTDQLFDALQESFRLTGPESDEEAARERFTHRALESAFLGRAAEPAVDFAPEPFELVPLEGGGALLLREDPQKCFFEGRSYPNARAFPRRRAGARRLWQQGDGSWLAGLWLLGEPIERHARIDLAGARIEKLSVGQEAGGNGGPADPLWKGAIELAALSQAALPLRPALAEVLAQSSLELATMEGDLARYERGRILLRAGLAPDFSARLEGLATQERLALSLQLFSELAQELVPALLGAAQELLAQAGAQERESLLSLKSQQGQARRTEELAPVLARLCARLAEGSAL